MVRSEVGCPAQFDKQQIISQCKFSVAECTPGNSSSTRLPVLLLAGSGTGSRGSGTGSRGSCALRPDSTRPAGPGGQAPGRAGGGKCALGSGGVPQGGCRAGVQGSPRDLGPPAASAATAKRVLVQLTGTTVPCARITSEPSELSFFPKYHLLTRFTATATPRAPGNHPEGQRWP